MSPVRARSPASVVSPYSTTRTAARGLAAVFGSATKSGRVGGNVLNARGGRLKIPSSTIPDAATYRVELAAGIVTDLETENAGIRQVLMRARRLANMVADRAAEEWIGFEQGGWPLVTPTHLADLAVALGRIPPAVAQEVVLGSKRESLPEIEDFILPARARSITESPAAVRRNAATLAGLRRGQPKPPWARAYDPAEVQATVKRTLEDLRRYETIAAKSRAELHPVGVKPVASTGFR